MRDTSVRITPNSATEQQVQIIFTLVYLYKLFFLDKNAIVDAALQVAVPAFW